MHKILMVMTGFNPSTMEKYHLMANGLEIADVRTHFIGFTDAPEKRKYFENVYLDGALYTYEYGSKRGLHQGRNILTRLANNTYMMARFFIRLFVCLLKERPALIIIPTQPIQVVFSAVILSKLFGIMMVPNIMEYYPAMPSFNKKRNFQVRVSWWLVLKYSDAYIVISRFLSEKIQAVSNKRIMRLPAILPQRKGGNESVQDYTDSNDKTILLYSSSSGYYELLDFCIKSLSLIKDMNYRLFITGKYSEEEISIWSNKLAELGMLDKVEFCGFLTEEELLAIQVKSHALLMPLTGDERHIARFPQKILGYMQLGKPVITTGVGEMSEYFNDGENIVMDNSVSENGFSRKISAVIESPEYADKIGRKGKFYVEEKFSMRSWGYELKTFINSL